MAEALVQLIALLPAIGVIAGYWKIFEKAGEPPWASIVPLYNLVVVFRLLNLSPWLVLTLFIPVVNIGVYLFYHWKLAKVFDKGVLYFFLLLFLPFIALPVLGFGDAEYNP